MAIAVHASAALQAIPPTATKAASTNAPFEAMLSALGEAGSDGAAMPPAARQPATPPVAVSQDPAPAKAAVGGTSAPPVALLAIPTQAASGSTPPSLSKLAAKTKPGVSNTAASTIAKPPAATDLAAPPPSSSVTPLAVLPPAVAPPAVALPGGATGPLTAAANAGHSAVAVDVDADTAEDAHTTAPARTVPTAATAAVASDASGALKPDAQGTPILGAPTPGTLAATVSAASSAAASSPAAVARSRTATNLVDRAANDLAGPVDTITAPTPLPTITQHVASTSAAELDTPATAGAAATPAADPSRVAQQAGAQVAVSLSRALANGSRTVTVQLHPDDLGRVELRLGFHPSGLSVQMTLQSRQTFEAFTENRSSLEQQFAQAGVDLGSNGLDLRFQQNSSDQNQSGRNLFSQTSTTPGLTDAANDPLAEAASQRLSGSAGLDIIA